MKKLLLIQIILIIVISCNINDDINSSSEINYKQEMRNFVIGISEYGKSNNERLIIIPQNGIELITINGEEDGLPHSSYLDAIDANGQEDFFYGYVKDNQATSTNDNSYLQIFLDKSKNHGNTIFITDYCSDHAYMDASYNQNNELKYISFAANNRELNNIPDYPNPIYGENNNVITSLSEVKNFLYLINPEIYDSKSDFIDKIISTNYDLLIMDLFFQDGIEFTANEIDQLKNKINGGRRLIISYMSIGEAENYRYYWKTDWNSNIPSWIDSENPDWVGNFKVKYWEEDWQNIIFGNDDSYMKKIMNANFDGVYLDIIDAFEYYE